MNLQARISHFFTLGDSFLTPGNPPFEAVKNNAYQQNSWFLPHFIDHAVAQINQQYLALDLLKSWTAAYPSIANTSTGKKVGIVMAGNIPLVGFHDLLSTLIAGHIAIVKLSSKDTVLMEYVIASLQKIDPAFKDLIIIQEQLKNCDAYIATGSNNTGRYFEQYFGKYPHIIRKNKTSVAFLDGKETESELALLADDMMLYFGMGCRNITQIWVPLEYDFIPLLNALKKYNYLGDEHKYKHNYDYQLALLMLNRQFYMDSGGILLSENPSPFAAISQIHYQFYTPGTLPSIDPTEVQCIVGKTGVPFGSPQTPSLIQYADGVDTLNFLSKL
jgi:Acyl-CoA reductase (LuxC)